MLQVNQPEKDRLVYHFMKEFERDFSVSLSNNLSICKIYLLSENNYPIISFLIFRVNFQTV